MSLAKLKKFIKEIKNRYNLEGFTDDEIICWIIIEFKHMQEMLISREPFIIKDMLDDSVVKTKKKPAKKKNSKQKK